MTVNELFPLPDLQDLPEDVRQKILDVQEKSGFVPNVFLTFARRPEEFRAFFAYHDSLMMKESGLSKAEREMIVVATSAENGCLYCVVAHGAILRIRAKAPLLADLNSNRPTMLNCLNMTSALRTSGTLAPLHRSSP
jgi:uncharacterized peroxidase-related enzyme